MTLQAGNRVRLEPFDNGLELIPSQCGQVLAIGDNPWGQSLIVLLDPQYRNVEDDDGLRECTTDQATLIYDNLN